MTTITRYVATGSKINEMCNVEDEVFGVRENLLIYRRTFELSKKDGVTTILGLGLPGVVQ
ncbi:MAG TPA: hypothetical protein PLM47_09160 [Smithellaceae bacterium]|nr:hypothetical protein [Smithellaceae bacterium]HPD49702.1 hypothetical protein [Smithellaceae bacterium]HRT36182.1 hypothetical protein [Smithellaceae bacterium]